MTEENQIPVVNVVAAGKSLSSINKSKKKRISKNVLGLPENAKIKPPIITDKEESEIVVLLQRQLPTARLPVYKKKKTDSKEEVPKPDVSQKEKERRLELSIGVNQLTRDIKKNNLVACLLASDIAPSHLTAHLNFKCNHNKIPYLYISKLRETIQEALGFPCIALGFKKNCSSFSEIVKKISEISDQFKKEDPVAKAEEEPEVDELEDINKKENMEKMKEEPEFTYKYRASNKEGTFIPDDENKNFGSDFIALTISDDEKEVENRKRPSGISQNFIKKSKKKKLKLENIGIDESEEVKKEKIQKDWVIDKAPKKQSLKYAKANVIRYQSNPNRKGKPKFMKKKKILQPEKSK